MMSSIVNWMKATERQKAGLSVPNCPCFVVRKCPYSGGPRPHATDQCVSCLLDPVLKMVDSRLHHGILGMIDAIADHLQMGTRLGLKKIAIEGDCCGQRLKVAETWRKYGHVVLADAL